MHVFNIANADVAYTKPTKELVQAVFPYVKYTPYTNNTREGLISIRRPEMCWDMTPSMIARAN